MKEPQLSTTAPHAKSRRIAFAHDWLVGYRGGEAVLERIIDVACQVAQPACLYTMFDEGRSLSPGIDALRRSGSVRTSSLTSLPRLRRWLLPLYPLAVSQLGATLRRDHTEQPIDLMISTSSAAIHGLRAPEGVPHVCYCHAPARYLWSQTGQYAGGLRGAALSLCAPALRLLDRRASRHVTTYLANSTATAALVRSCFGRDATVVHPPVRTDFFTPLATREEEPEGTELPKEPFLLIAGALEPYKRTDLAIGVAKRLNRRLVIAGDGTQTAHLRSLAAGVSQVSFFGPATHSQLRALYRAADALLYPQIEDFGITAAEAQACGTPVVAVGIGGALDTVRDGITGSLSTDQTVESLAAAVGKCPAKPACSQSCRENAVRFAAKSFDERLASIIRTALG